jgi:hypothetical protein
MKIEPFGVFHYSQCWELEEDQDLRKARLAGLAHRPKVSSTPSAMITPTWRWNRSVKTRWTSCCSPTRRRRRGRVEGAIRPRWSPPPTTSSTGAE